MRSEVSSLFWWVFTLQSHYCKWETSASGGTRQWLIRLRLLYKASNFSPRSIQWRLNPEVSNSIFSPLGKSLLATEVFDWFTQPLKQQQNPPWKAWAGLCSSQADLMVCKALGQQAAKTCSDICLETASEHQWAPEFKSLLFLLPNSVEPSESDTSIFFFFWS